MISDLRQMDRNVWIRFIGETLNGIAFMMLNPFFALYLEDKVGSLFLVGIIMAIAPIVAIFGSMLGGKLADTYGRKPVMVLSMLLNGIVLLGFLWAEDFWGCLILSALMGLFNSLFDPAASAMVADVTPKEKRTEAYGLLRMGHNIGTAIGPIIGISVFTFSKEILFIGTSVTLIFYGLLVLFGMKETLPEVVEKEVKDKNLPSTFQVLWRDKLLLMFILAGIVVSMGFSQTEGMLPLHFENEMYNIFGEKNPYAYCLALNGLLVVLFQFPISRWAADKSVGKMMFYGVGAFGIGLLAIGWFPTILGNMDASKMTAMPILLITFAFYTLGEMLMSPVQMTFVANLAPEELRGTYMGAAGLQWIIGGAVGPLMGGYFLDESLGNLLFTILGIGCLISACTYILIDKMAERHFAEKK